jgi:hypothetical protein
VKSIVLFCGAFAIVASGALAMDLPHAPAGFSWKELPEIKAAFLIPAGWHFKREMKNGTLGYFITREDIGALGHFNTGLTVNVFRRFSGGPAVAYAENFISKIALSHSTPVRAMETGPFRGFGCRYAASDAEGSVTIHELMVANPKTNTLYLFLFESPTSEWSSAWKIGEKIIDMLAIDDDI